LCGGHPSFEVAKNIKDVVLRQGASCHIIHVDNPTEATRSEDTFLPLQWDAIVEQKISYDRNLEREIGPDRIKQIFEQFKPPRTPFDHPLAVRIAASATFPAIRDHLERELEQAHTDGKDVRVGVCLVPEGPTGTGVAWALLNMLPDWKNDYLLGIADAGGAPEPLDLFLLEFAPADPAQDGNRGNVIQGYLTRQRLYQMVQKGKWKDYWFRFDGGKLFIKNNDVASKIGARAVSFLLTRRLTEEMQGQSYNGSSSNGSSGAVGMDVAELLNTIQATDLKPIELTLAGINMPVDEGICALAGTALKKWKADGNKNLVLDGPGGAREFGDKWKNKYPEVSNQITEVEKAKKRSWLTLSGKTEQEGSDGKVSSLRGILDVLWLSVPVLALALMLIGAYLMFWLFLDFEGAALMMVGFVGLVLFIGVTLFRSISRSRAIRQAEQALVDVTKRTVDYELSGGLVDVTSARDGIMYLRWYIHYPFTHDNERFEQFLGARGANSGTLAQIVEKFNHDDVFQIKRRLSDYVRWRISTTRWLPQQDASRQKTPNRK
jgi:hypothetical protein